MNYMENTVESRFHIFFKRMSYNLYSCEGTSPSAAQRGAFRHRPPTLGSSSLSIIYAESLPVCHTIA
jgi:hypothetical protein